MAKDALQQADGLDLSAGMRYEAWLIRPTSPFRMPRQGSSPSLRGRGIVRADEGSGSASTVGGEPAGSRTIHDAFIR
jgi:hypothetical protein